MIFCTSRKMSSGVPVAALILCSLPCFSKCSTTGMLDCTKVWKRLRMVSGLSSLRPLVLPRSVKRSSIVFSGQSKNSACKPTRNLFHLIKHTLNMQTSKNNCSDIKTSNKEKRGCGVIQYLCTWISSTASIACHQARWLRIDNIVQVIASETGAHLELESLRPLLNTSSAENNFRSTVCGFVCPDDEFIVTNASGWIATQPCSAIISSNTGKSQPGKESIGFACRMWVGVLPSGMA